MINRRFPTVSWRRDTSYPRRDALGRQNRKPSQTPPGPTVSVPIEPSQGCATEAAYHGPATLTSPSVLEPKTTAAKPVLPISGLIYSYRLRRKPP